jgi:hypothetical protein
MASLERHERRLEDNIKINLKNIGCKGVFWNLSDSGYGPLSGSFKQGIEPSESIKGMLTS